MNKLYHYSSESRDKLKCLALQVKDNPDDFTDEVKKEIAKLDDWYVKGKHELPYSGHISLHIDPLPVDLILEHFPKESPYFKLDVIYEHVIYVDKLEPALPWQIVESKSDNFIFNHLLSDTLYDNVSAYKKLYHRSKGIIGRLLGQKGTGNIALLESLKEYKGKIRNYFFRWMDSKDFQSSAKRQYATGVPHVFIYPKRGYVVPKSVKEISLKR